MKCGRLRLLILPVLIGTISPTFLSAQNVDVPKLIDLPDTNGSLLVTGTGQATGSRFQIRYRFEGAYQFSQPLLTLSEQPGSPVKNGGPHDLADFTFLFPKQTSLYVTGQLHGIRSSEGRKPGADDFVTMLNRFSVSDNYQLPGIPETQPVTSPIYQGHGIGITIADRDRVGRGTQLHINTTSTTWNVATAARNAALAKALPENEAAAAKDLFWRGNTRFSDAFRDAQQVSSNEEALPLGFSVSLGGSAILSSRRSIPSRVGVTGYGVNLSVVAPQLIKATASATDDERIKFQGTRTVTAKTDNDTNTILGGDDTYTIRVDYRIGLPEGNVVIRPREADEEQFLPNPGRDLSRRYTVELRDIAPGDVDAIRVRLEDVSQHKGIATNAGNHARFVERGTCRDCGAAVSGETHTVACDVGGHAVSRNYTGYSDCPIDHMPDMFFRWEGDNDTDWKLDPPSSDSELLYKTGDTLICENVDKDEFEVNVRIHDGAATARLTVEFQMDGVWMPGLAEGVSANSSNDYLMIPIDTNNNGMGDSWIGDAMSTDGDNEGDARSAATGDGLTTFEEYRSVFSRGVFYSKRLDPQKREVFVHDYSGVYGTQLNSVTNWYRNQDLCLMQLKDFEIQGEVVNWKNSRHKRGDQYTIVMMNSTDPRLPAELGAASPDWALVGGRATRGDRITPQANTAIIGSPRTDAEEFALQQAMGLEISRLIAHEIGHVMGCRHHGDGDYWESVDGKRVLVAVPGGSHSGHATCFMRYQQAQKFLNGDRKSGTLTDYPEDKVGRDCFCESRQGTGINGSAWSGDATHGRCLHQIRLRSW